MAAETHPDPSPMLTSEQGRDLADHFGSQRAAARAIGVDESTLRYWLDPESKRARVSEHYHALSGYEYNRRLLQKRRQCALRRRARRMVALHG